MTTQYGQDVFARALWTVNFLLRTALSKLPGPALGFYRHSFLLVQDASLSYREVSGGVMYAHMQALGVGVVPRMHSRPKGQEARGSLGGDESCCDTPNQAYYNPHAFMHPPTRARRTVRPPR